MHVKQIHLNMVLILYCTDQKW